MENQNKIELRINRDEIFFVCEGYSEEFINTISDVINARRQCIVNSDDVKLERGVPAESNLGNQASLEGLKTKETISKTKAVLTHGQKITDGHKNIEDNKESIIKDIKTGFSITQLKSKYGISNSSFYRLKEKCLNGETGGNGEGIFTEEERKSIVEEFLSIPDRTEEDVIMLGKKHRVKYKTIYSWVKKYAAVLGMPYKKNSGGLGLKKRMHDQTTRKDKIIAAVNAGKSMEEIEGEIGHISERSSYRYIREAKIAKGESVAKSNRRAVRLNRNEIIGDINAGIPDEEILKKWGISRATLRRHKIRVSDKNSGNTGGQIVADGYIEKVRKVGFKPTAVSEEDKAKITDDIRLGLFSRQILKKYHINIHAYSEIKKFMEAEKNKAVKDEDDLKDIKKPDTVDINKVQEMMAKDAAGKFKPAIKQGIRNWQEDMIARGL